MEAGKGLVLVEKKRVNSNNTVIQIVDPQDDHVTKEISGSQSSLKSFELCSSYIDQVAETDINDQDLGSCRNQLPIFAGSASPDNKPAVIPTGQFLSRRKPVSRFEEPPEEQDDSGILVEGNTELMKLTPPRTPLMASPEREDEGEELHKRIMINKKLKKGNKLKKYFLLIELIAFVCLMGY